MADAPLLVAGFLALVGLGYAVAPWAIVRGRAARPATGDYARRLDRLRERAGLDASRTYLLDVKEDDRAAAHVRGLPNRRVLFVTEYLYDEFDDGTIAGLLAAQAGAVAVGYAERRTVGLAALGVVVLVVLSMDWGTGPLLAGGLFVAFVLALHVAFPAYCRRLVYAADDVAADRVGGDVVADALVAATAGRAGGEEPDDGEEPDGTEGTEDDDGGSPEPPEDVEVPPDDALEEPGLSRYLRFRPPTRERVRRLRGRG